MDEVEKVLLKQQTLVVAFIEKVKRAINHLDREVAQLEAVKAKLVADLRDKVSSGRAGPAVAHLRMGGGLVLVGAGVRWECAAWVARLRMRCMSGSLANALRGQLARCQLQRREEWTD